MPILLLLSLRLFQCEFTVNLKFESDTYRRHETYGTATHMYVGEKHHRFLTMYLTRFECCFICYSSLRNPGKDQTRG